MGFHWYWSPRGKQVIGEHKTLAIMLKVLRDGLLNKELQVWHVEVVGHMPFYHSQDTAPRARILGESWRQAFQNCLVCELVLDKKTDWDLGFELLVEKEGVNVEDFVFASMCIEPGPETPVVTVHA